MSNWINIKTRLPNDDDLIFMTDEFGQVYSGTGGDFNKAANEAGGIFAYTTWKLRAKP